MRTTAQLFRELIEKNYYAIADKLDDGFTERFMCFALANAYHAREMPIAEYVQAKNEIEDFISDIYSTYDLRLSRDSYGTLYTCMAVVYPWRYDKPNAEKSKEAHSLLLWTTIFSIFNDWDNRHDIVRNLYENYRRTV